MGKIILVTGGARSGKSTYAESLVKSFGQEAVYIATSVPFDDEMKDRIKKHRESRPGNWHTFEAYRNIKNVYNPEYKGFEAVLLDCITVMISNLIFDMIGDKADDLKDEDISGIERSILQEISDFLDAASLNPQPVVIVTNEIGCGIVPDNKLARIFRDIAGRANQFIASRADEVYMAVCGIPLKIK